ncbi:MAG: nucleotidyltransferase family protein, partial [Candidatus Limnocylindrales bacterium]
GRPMLQHVLDRAAAAELRPVIVVSGDDTDQIEAAIVWRGETRVRNPDPSRGMSSSVALGLGELGDDVDCALVLLGDQPFLTLENVRAMTAAPRDPAKPIVVPRHAGQAGNPVLLERAAWPLAIRLTGDRGMSQLFTRHPELVRYVDVDTTSPDIDTPDDLVRITAVRRGEEPGRSGRTEAVGRHRP